MANYVSKHSGKQIDAAVAAFLAGGGIGSVEVDTTLTQAGKAADAKATGERLAALSEEIAGEKELQFVPVSLDVVKDAYYGKDGNLYQNVTNRAHASVDVSHGEKYRLTTIIGSALIPAIVKYGSDGAFIGYEKAGTGSKEQIIGYEFVIEENVSRIVVQTAYENNQPKLALEKETEVPTKSFYTKSESDE